MRRSCCFASFVATTGSAETPRRSLQWRLLDRKLPPRRRVLSCAASAPDYGDARKAGAAAADAVFRHLDASLDDEDDGDVLHGQGEKRVLRRLRTGTTVRADSTKCTSFWSLRPLLEIRVLLVACWTSAHMQPSCIAYATQRPLSNWPGRRRALCSRAPCKRAVYQTPAAVG